MRILVTFKKDNEILKKKVLDGEFVLGQKVNISGENYVISYVAGEEGEFFSKGYVNSDTGEMYEFVATAELEII